MKAAKSDKQKYNFNESGIGNSWLIGADNSNHSNAFKNGVSDCPVNLTIPSSLTDDKGETKIVEIIGQYAFYACADRFYNGTTRSLTLTKQVKVIKQYGLGSMDDLEIFKIEEGSVLETIEQFGLEYIGFDTGQAPVNRTGTLILPSTLSSVSEDGIFQCNLFHTIIYCGSRPLLNYSTLEYPVSKIVIKVTSEYPSDENIFGREPDRDSQAEVQEKCEGYISDGFRTEPAESESGVIITGWGNSLEKWCPKSLEIPPKLKGSDVVAINESAFKNCETDGPISLPSSVKRIGAYAFANTSRVTNISIASNEIDVGKAAFLDCGKKAQQPLFVSLPHNTQLNDSAFEGANMKEIRIS